MNLFKAAFLIVMSFLSIAAGNGGDWSVLSQEEFGKVFKQQEVFYKEKTSYDLNIWHASYENFSSTIPYERMEGFFKRDGKNYHSFLMGIHTIQNSRIKIVVDSSDKKIMIANPDDAFQPIATKDLANNLKGYNSIKVRSIENGKIYRIEYKENIGSLSALEYVTAANGTITKMVMYYNELSYDPGFRKKEEKYKPRMEVEFRDYKPGAKNNKEDFDEGKFIALQGAKYKGIGKYESYRIFDTRYTATQ